MGGVRSEYLTIVQAYYITVKEIGVTDVMDIGTCKTMRKTEQDEILKLLEGPVEHETNDITRFRARSVIIIWRAESRPMVLKARLS